MSNVVQVLVTEIEELLAPLSRVAVSDDPLTGLRRFLKVAGWRMTEDIDPAPIVTGIDAVLDAILAASDGVEPEDLGQFIEAIDGIRQLVEAIDDLIDLISRGGPAPPAPEDIEAFAEDVLHVLAVGWLRRKPVVGDLSSILGLVETVDVPARIFGGWLERPARRSPRLRPDAIAALLEDPVDYVKGRVVPNDWAQSADAAATNLVLSSWLRPLLARFGGRWHVHPASLASPEDAATSARMGRVAVAMPFADDDGRLNFGAEFELFSAADTNDAGQRGPAVEIAPFGGYAHTFDFGSWSLDSSVMIALGGVDVGDSPPLLRFSSTGVESEPSLDVQVGVGAGIDMNSIVGGNSTRLELGRLEADTFVSVTEGEWDTGVSVVASTSKLVLSAADLGAIVGAVASGFETTIEFDLGLQWTLANGVMLAGSAALELELSEGIDIGGVIKLDGLRVRLEIGEEIGLNAVTNVGVNLGPVVITIGDIGLGFELSFPSGGGNLGGVNLGIAAAPPSSIGIVVDASVVKGGGYLYLNPDRGEYAGVLELSFEALSLSIKAIGIFTTDLPDGSEGYALALLVFTEFPEIQLGYGFTLNGVGGILGIQHGVSIEALQSGMRSGVLDSVLFPPDPVANAPALIDDIRAVFPISPGSLTFGPALQIGWGQGIITISLGLVLQLDNVIGPGAGDPELARIVLLGQLKVELPPAEDAPEIVKLLVDVLGYYDFDEQELGVDAALRDSHVATLPITGSLVIRARFGDNPTFLMAIGGFHPRFTDIPPGIPPQDRLGIQLRYGILVVQVTCYTAITSNSFQFGAEVSLYASAASFKVEAYLGFDALFIFQPRFHFTFDFRVGAAISWKDWDLASIRVRGTVSGPGRWEIDGTASFSILFWDIEIEFDEAWGHAPLDSLPSKPVLPEVLAALADPAAWSTSLPEGRMYATLRADPTADSILAHPLGSLHVRQKVMPFGIAVDKVGGARPSDVNRVDLDSIRIGDQLVTPAMSQEHFARNDHFDLNEDQKLTSPSFERFDAGARAGTDEFDTPSATAFDPDYETVYLEQPDVIEFVVLPGSFLVRQAIYGAAARSYAARGAQLRGKDSLAVSVQDSPYAAARSDVLTSSSQGVVETTYTEAVQVRGKHADTLVVVEQVEMSA